jgi:hypothetical protein
LGVLGRGGHMGQSASEFEVKSNLQTIAVPWIVRNHQSQVGLGAYSSDKSGEIQA